MTVNNTVGTCEIFFIIMFKKNAAKQVFFFFEIMPQIIFIICSLYNRIRNISSRYGNPGSHLGVDLS